MGRRGGKNDNNDVKEVVNDFIDLMLDDIRNELRDILTELEIYQKTWVVPWFVQKFLSDLHIRLSLLLDKLGRSM
jgi:hypothetical protein